MGAIRVRKFGNILEGLVFFVSLFVHLLTLFIRLRDCQIR